MAVQDTRDAATSQAPRNRPRRSGARRPLPDLPRQPGGALCPYSVATLVCAFLVPPLAVPFGFAALRCAARRGERGSGLAIAGLLLGTVLSALIALFIALLVLFSGG